MTEDQPLISVVTPSFNQVAFLEETIRSVLEQDYANFEYLVIDGGSTDGSVEILRKYSGRLTYWCSEADRGQAHAVNKGWERSRGDILGWLNSDDQYRQGTLAKLAEAYLVNPRAALIYGDCAEMDSENREIRVKSMVNFSLRSLLCGKNMGQPSVFVTQAGLFRGLVMGTSHCTTPWILSISCASGWRFGLRNLFMFPP